MIVVAIVVILFGVAFVEIFSYMRSITKLQYDVYAKEIFIAAQNHLSMAQGQGYLGRTDFGTEEDDIDGQADTGDGAYYFVVSSDHTSVNDQTSVLNLMLPVAAVDETLRLGGSYIVRYHKDSAQVLDVFYWSEKPGRFQHQYANDYETFMANRENKDALKNYSGAVIGYYGGVDAASLTRGEEILAPEIVVTNAEKLYVTVQETNDTAVTGATGYTLKLVITGQTSGVSKEIVLNGTTGTNVEYDNVNKKYTVLLDDITQSNMHFYNLFCSGASDNLIPGEDIEIQAVALNNAQLTNVAYSSEQTTNSLYDSLTTNGSGGTVAMIGNIRHLENLSDDISKVNGIGSGLQIAAAEQITDLSWPEFQEAIDGDSSGAAAVYNSTGTNTAVGGTGYFFPLSPNYGLDYDGKNYSISDVAVNCTGDAGLFGYLNSGSVSNLKLIDFSISGTDAGALAGVISGAQVNNVLAYHTDDSSAATITGTGSVGGLIGSAASSTVTNSAAALAVESTGGAAGGLIGTASGTTAVSGCYSGGHTESGAYDDTAYNVTGNTAAGGLIGEFSGASVANSYSTCSASGATAGGLVGTASGTFTNCYATGLVDGTTKGAFAGALSGTATGCQYFEIINEVRSGDEVTYLPSVGGAAGATSGITALDKDTSSYRSFVGGTSESAVVYDPMLNLYYQGKYTLKTVEQLGASLGADDFVAVHYGDWPAPELWVINIK